VKTSKKIFFGFVAIFACFIAYVSYDIGSRTTFPGSKSQLKERIKSKYQMGDSTPHLPTDTLQR
jgi:amino acid permease